MRTKKTTMAATKKKLPPTGTGTTPPTKRPFSIVSRLFLLFLVLLVVSVLCQLSMTISFVSQEHPPHENGLMHPLSSSAAAVASSSFLRRSKAAPSSSSSSHAPIMETMQQLRHRLPPSIWTVAGTQHQTDPLIIQSVTKLLTSEELLHAKQICAKVVFSTVRNAITVQGNDMTYVATGDIDR